MSLFGAISISASGLDAQRTRAELITENLANADTTRTPEGGPYRRKDAVFTATSAPLSFDDATCRSPLPVARPTACRWQTSWWTTAIPNSATSPAIPMPTRRVMFPSLALTQLKKWWI